VGEVRVDRTDSGDSELVIVDYVIVPTEGGDLFVHCQMCFQAIHWNSALSWNEYAGLVNDHTEMHNAQG
jgi:hypothetical protein